MCLRGYVYQLVKFGDLMNCGSKDISKMHPVTCTDTHHDVKDLENYWMFKMQKLEYLENGT